MLEWCCWCARQWFRRWRYPQHWRFSQHAPTNWVVKTKRKSSVSRRLPGLESGCYVRHSLERPSPLCSLFHRPLWQPCQSSAASSPWWSAVHGQSKRQIPQISPATCGQTFGPSKIAISWTRKLPYDDLIMSAAISRNEVIYLIQPNQSRYVRYLHATYHFYQITNAKHSIVRHDKDIWIQIHSNLINEPAHAYNVGFQRELL